MVVFSVALLRPPVVRVYVIEESKGSPQFFQLCGVASCARSHQFVPGSAQDVAERKAFHIAPQFCTLRFETISTLRARQHAHSALREPDAQVSARSGCSPPQGSPSTIAMGNRLAREGETRQSGSVRAADTRRGVVRLPCAGINGHLWREHAQRFSGAGKQAPSGLVAVGGPWLQARLARSQPRGIGWAGGPKVAGGGE